MTWKGKKKGIIEFMSESKENITLRKALPWFLSERRGILQPNTESRTSQTSINHNNTSYTHSNKQSKYTRKSSTVLSRAQLSKPHKSNKSSSKTTHPNHFYIQYMIIHSKDWRTVATNHHPPSLLMPFLSFFLPAQQRKLMLWLSFFSRLSSSAPLFHALFCCIPAYSHWTCVRLQSLQASLGLDHRAGTG